MYAALLRCRPDGAVRAHHHTAPVGHGGARIGGERPRAGVDAVRKKPIVGVEKDHQVAGRRLEAVVARRGETSIRLPDVSHPDAAGRHGWRIVGRAIVHDDHFDVIRQRHRALHRLLEEVPLVVAGDDDGDQRAMRVHTNPFTNRSRSSARNARSQSATAIEPAQAARSRAASRSR